MDCFAETEKTLQGKRNFVYGQISTMLIEYSEMLREIKDLDESDLDKLNKILEKQKRSVGL